MAVRSTLHFLLPGLLALALGGCVSFRTTRADGTVVVHHFGYVREERPPATGGVQVAAFASLGIHLDTAFTLGLWESRFESVPLDGRLVLRVANQAQLDAALRALSPETSTSPCILVDSSN
jgi:hypothetical protein